MLVSLLLLNPESLIARNWVINKNLHSYSCWQKVSFKLLGKVVRACNSSTREADADGFKSRPNLQKSHAVSVAQKAFFWKGYRVSQTGFK